MRSPGRAQRSPAAALAALKFALDHPLVDNEDVGDAPTHHLQVPCAWPPIVPSHPTPNVSGSNVQCVTAAGLHVLDRLSLPPELVQVGPSHVLRETHVSVYRHPGRLDCLCTCNPCPCTFERSPQSWPMPASYDGDGPRQTWNQAPSLHEHVNALNKLASEHVSRLALSRFDHELGSVRGLSRTVMRSVHLISVAVVARGNLF